MYIKIYMKLYDIYRRTRVYNWTACWATPLAANSIYFYVVNVNTKREKSKLTRHSQETEIMSARERCHWHRVDSFASYFASYAKICHKTCLLKKKNIFCLPFSSICIGCHIRKYPIQYVSTNTVILKIIRNICDF